MADGRESAAAQAAYTDTFFKDMAGQSGSSAAVVVPLLCEMFEPASVIDVGCGTGEWLAEFVRSGVEDVHGLDGPWVDPARLSIEPARFQAADLENPPELGRRYDLVTSFEVAEHLPPQAAEPFVRYLTELGDTVAFSAAIPFQGGTSHLNERWQSYWSDLFEARGFLAFDLVRPQIWLKPEVEFWYRQNLVVYMSAERAAAFPHEPTDVVLPLVHPDLLERQAAQRSWQPLARLRTRLRLRSRLKRR
ncbi:MAG TPA: class I SAM-dependent methyltransferase [Solirubrobacterales bacterium]|nr:class I SAM-dependent methyltransferase [Solirubrobacterales bacterium]